MGLFPGLAHGYSLHIFPYFASPQGEGISPFPMERLIPFLNDRLVGPWQSLFFSQAGIIFEKI
jgi:hypothetical protein